MTVALEISQAAADELLNALTGGQPQAIESTAAILTVACVLRPNASGVWSILEDAGHAALGVSGISQTTSGIVLDFDFTASKVLTFIAAPDETLAKARFNVGASVGLASATIQMATPTSSPVNPSTVTNTLSNIWVYGLFMA